METSYQSTNMKELLEKECFPSLYLISIWTMNKCAKQSQVKKRLIEVHQRWVSQQAFKFLPVVYHGHLDVFLISHWTLNSLQDDKF